MKILDQIFQDHKIKLWGIVSLTSLLKNGGPYTCVAFCLPYDTAAVAALPDDELIHISKARLNKQAAVVYDAIRGAIPDCHFYSFDEADAKFGLRANTISQKVVAHLAGLGWIGKSSLLVTQEYGPRVRIGILLATGSVEPTERSYAGKCGECLECIKACPVNAISDTKYDVETCKGVVLDDHGEYKTFCGLCMKVCPIGI